MCCLFLTGRTAPLQQHQARDLVLLHPDFEILLDHQRTDPDIILQ